MTTWKDVQDMANAVANAAYQKQGYPTTSEQIKFAVFELFKLGFLVEKSDDTQAKQREPDFRTLTKLQVAINNNISTKTVDLSPIFLDNTVTPLVKIAANIFGITAADIPAGEPRNVWNAAYNRI